MGKKLNQMKKVSKSRRHLMATSEVWVEDNNTEGRTAVMIQTYGSSSLPFAVYQYNTFSECDHHSNAVSVAHRRNYVQAEAAVNRWIESGLTSD